MLASLAITFLHALAAALQAPLAPPPPDPGPGDLLWERVQAAHAEVLSGDGGQDAVFAAFEAFSAADLRLALELGIAAVRAEAAGDATAEARVQEVLAICLTPYPLAAQSAEDLDIFLGHLENLKLDPVYRLYLLRRVVPGLAPQSPFSEYLQEGAWRQYTELNARLGRLEYNPREEARVQAAAMEAHFRLHVESLHQILQDEAALVPNLDPADAASALRALKTPDLKLNPRLQRLVQQKQQDFLTLAKSISRHVAAGSESPRELRERAAALLRRIETEAPLKNPAELRALIPAELRTP